MTASYALTAYGGATRQLRAALVFAAVNLPGSIIFLMSVAGTYPRARGTMWLPPLGDDRQEGP